LPDHLHGLLSNIVDAMVIGFVLSIWGEGYGPEETTIKMMMGRLDWFDETFRPKT
jgi:hypothetical protein